MLPQMAAGLNSILFAITIDNEILNFWSSSTPSLLENGTTDEDILAPKTVKSVGSGAGAISEEKKKTSLFVSFTFLFKIPRKFITLCYFSR